MNRRLNTTVEQGIEEARNEAREAKLAQYREALVDCGPSTVCELALFVDVLTQYAYEMSQDFHDNPEDTRRERRMWNRSATLLETVTRKLEAVVATECTPCPGERRETQ